MQNKVKSACMVQLTRLATPFFGGMAVGSCMVVGPAYVVTVGLKPSAVAGADQRKGCTERQRQQLIG